MKTKSPVQLRAKKLKDGSKSLYLDLYRNGARQYIFLKMYISPGTDPISKATNKRILEAAEIIRAKKAIEVQGGLSTARQHMRMSEIFQDYRTSRILTSKSNKEGIDRAERLWMEYFNTDRYIDSITPGDIKAFVLYLSSRECSWASKIDRREFDRMKNNETTKKISTTTGVCMSHIRKLIRTAHAPVKKTLSPSTVITITRTIRAIFNRAAKTGVINDNPFNKLERSDFPKVESKGRTHLSIEDIQRLRDTPIYNTKIKQAFLFACFTGLRWSDIVTITWEMIDRRRIELIQKKTSSYVIVPISDNAMEFIPRERAGQYVFDGIKLENTNVALKKWASDAGLKPISFHVARHTFATMALTYGADIYTVSNLLGHRSIATTQIYAKIVDKKREEAVNAIPDITAPK